MAEEANNIEDLSSLSDQSDYANVLRKLQETLQSNQNVMEDLRNQLR